MTRSRKSLACEAGTRATWADPVVRARRLAGIRSSAKARAARAANATKAAEAWSAKAIKRHADRMDYWVDRLELALFPLEDGEVVETFTQESRQTIAAVFAGFERSIQRRTWERRRR